jgi:hypothetical protein
MLYLDRMSSLKSPKEVRKKKKLRRDLTIREKRLLKYLATASSISEAMRLAGYAATTISSGTARRKTLENPRIIEEMNRMGMNDTFCLKYLKDGFEANKVISAVIMSKEAMKDADSMTKDFIEVPDFDCRHKYLTTALKLRGYLHDKKEEEEQGRDIKIQINYFSGKPDGKPEEKKEIEVKQLK